MKRTMRDVFLTVLGLALLASVSPADPGKKGDDKQEDSGKKVIVIQLDVSKLPADVLEKLLKLAGMGDKKPGEKKPEIKKPEIKKPDLKKPQVKKFELVRGKQIGLADAIGIAEKHTNGKAVKAEAEDDGFEVEVKTDKGNVKVEVNRAGDVVEKDKKKPGKKKGD